MNDQGSITVNLKDDKARFDALASAAKVRPSTLARTILRQWLSGELVPALPKPGNLNEVSAKQ